MVWHAFANRSGPVTLRCKKGKQKSLPGEVAASPGRPNFNKLLERNCWLELRERNCWLELRERNSWLKTPWR
jgi:hypothetical protein